MSYACMGCGRFAFHEPAICFWCLNDNVFDRAMAVDIGIERMMHRGKDDEPWTKEKEFEQERQRLAKKRKPKGKK